MSAREILSIVIYTLVNKQSIWKDDSKNTLYFADLCFVVLGRCLPAIITEGIDTAQSLAEKVGNDNYTSDIVDSQNKTVTIESILDGSA